MNSLATNVKKLLANTYILFALIALTAVGSGIAGVQAFNIGENKTVSSNSCSANICVALTPTGINPDAIVVKKGETVQFNSADGKVHNMSLGSGTHGKESDDHKAHAVEDDHEHAPGQEHDEPVIHQHEGEYQSGDFEADEAWRVQFNEVGTFDLHDHYNPDLRVTVVVYEEGGDNTIKR